MPGSAITQLTEYFAPADSFDEDQRALAGAHVAVCFLTVFLTLLVVVLLPFSPLDRDQLLISEVVAALTIVGYSISLISLRYSGRLTVAIKIYSVTILANIVSVVFLTGGFSESPQLILLLFVPIWSFLMLEQKDGLIAGVVVAVVVVSLYFLEASGFVFQQYIPVGARPFMQLQAWVGQLVILVSGLYIHVHRYNALNGRLNVERGQFAYKSLHDPLTGLANRTLFYRRAQASLEHALEGDLKMGLIYLDLDKFKAVNDTYGHEAGDKVLTVIAERLQEVVRGSDTVARLGGDEFAIVLHGLIDIDAARRICGKVVDCINKPITHDEYVLHVSVSAGAAVAPDHGTQLDDLCSLADDAMYEAKDGLASICFAQGVAVA